MTQTSAPPQEAQSDDDEAAQRDALVDRRDRLALALSEGLNVGEELAAVEERLAALDRRRERAEGAERARAAREAEEAEKRRREARERAEERLRELAAQRAHAAARITDALGRLGNGIRDFEEAARAMQAEAKRAGRPPESRSALGPDSSGLGSVVARTVADASCAFAREFAPIVGLGPSFGGAPRSATRAAGGFQDADARGVRKLLGASIVGEADAAQDTDGAESEE